MATLVGQIIGNYRIESLLGRGGMGDVYRGQHLHLNRPAAIKLLHANIAADLSFQARFRQEAQAAASLNHPHVVEVFDYGEQEERAYLVMELVPDGSLRALLQRRAAGQGWPLSLGLDLVRQAAEGLAYAHAQGMVHRDIKPDNLLLRRAGDPAAALDQYTLKISDFGLAKLAEGSGLTASGIVMGTPAYMSPEQCQGCPLDGRADLYALGVVLYEVATGYLPFQAKTMTEAAYKHVHTPPPPPRQLRPDLPPALETIILRCLAKAPDQRYATGSELAEALAATANDPVLASIHGPGAPPPETAIADVPADSATPPPAPQVASATRVPRVCLQDAIGDVVRQVDLTTNGVSIGRDAGNDLTVEDPAVSRHHLRIGWDGERATVTDLGSRNGTTLGASRLLPQATRPWSSGDAIRLGQFWVRLMPPTSTRSASPLDATVNVPAGPIITHDLPPSPQARPLPERLSATLSDRLAIKLDQESLALVPGQPTVVRATLANQRDTVDHLAVAVEGVSPAWVSGPTQPVQLNPGGQETVALTITVPRVPASRAGEYPISVEGRSREYPGEWTAVRARWTVLPFAAESMTLRPARAAGRGAASYALALRNDGNTPVAFVLAGEDDEDKLRYRFDQPTVSLPPGSGATVRVGVRAARRLVGRNDPPYPFTLRARPGGGGTPQAAAGQFVNVPLLPAWLPSRLGIAAAGIGLLLVYLVGLRPVLPPPLGSAPTPTVAHMLTTPTIAPTPNLTATVATSQTQTATALPKASIVEHSAAAQVPPGSTVTVSVPCAGGEQMLGGGYSLSDTDYVSASYPSDANTWTAIASDTNTTVPRTLTVYVDCLKANFDAGMRQQNSTVTVLLGQGGTASVDCPSGTVVTGGGVLLTPSTPLTGWITGSAPTNTGWTAAAFTLGGSAPAPPLGPIWSAWRTSQAATSHALTMSSGPLTEEVFALCASHVLQAATPESVSFNVPATATNQVQIACGPSQLLTSGGLTNANVNGDLYAVFPYQDAAAQDLSTWNVAAFDYEGADHAATAWATCVTLPS